MGENQMGENQQKALKVVRRYMYWSGGAGLIPIPFVDVAAVAGVQLKMLAELSRIYGVRFNENRGKAAIASLSSLVIPHAVAFGPVGSLVAAAFTPITRLLTSVPLIAPVAGAPVMGLASAAYAWALGKMFIQHFESGGTFLNFNPEQVKERFRMEFEEGKRRAASKDADAGAPLPA